MSVERADRLAKLVSEQGLERLLVTNLVNVRYLTGFSGTNGACLCGPGDRAFLTDFRYIERAASEIGGWELVAVSVAWTTGLAERLSGRCGFEDQHVSVRELRELTEKAPEGAELVPAGGLPEQLRRVKDPDERNAIAEAAKLADQVYEWTIEQGLAGKTEIEVARAAVTRMRELGAEPSFPPIVAAGSNGAMPHAWWSSTWGPSSTGTAPIAPGRSRSESPPAPRRRSTSSSSRHRPRHWTRSRRERPAGRWTRLRAR